MIENKVGAIPVVLPDTREVVGIASYIDVLRVSRNWSPRTELPPHAARPPARVVRSRPAAAPDRRPTSGP